MKKRLKNAEEAKVLREELLKNQSEIDPILGTKITHPVLDHQHFAPFKCRAVLQSEVNAFEGKVYNAYRRYIKHLSGASLPEVLRALATYLETDFPDRPIHHTGILDEIRPFKRLDAESQKRILTSLGVVPAESAAKRTKQIRTALQKEQIDYQTLLCQCKEKGCPSVKA